MNPLTVSQLAAILGPNWRTPENTKRNVARLVKSYRAHGVLSGSGSIILDRRTGKIRDGYCRVKALQQSGYQGRINVSLG